MYAIRTKNGLLNGFYSNDLPTTRKLYINEQNDKLEPKFTMRSMMNCIGGYECYNSAEEAKERIDCIKKWVEESRERYEKSLQGSTDKVLSVVNDFTIVKLKNKEEGRK